jgi:hypothetical protein
LEQFIRAVGDLGGAEMSSSVLVTYGLKVNLGAPVDLMSGKAEADQAVS